MDMSPLSVRPLLSKSYADGSPQYRSSKLTSEVLHKSGQMVFGSQWDAADCLAVSRTILQLRWTASSLPQGQKHLSVIY